MPSDFDLYLASQSPRRRELLDQLGVRYRVLAVDLSEARHPGEAPEIYALRLALDKARAGRALLAAEEPHPVLGADTVVVLDGEPLGKPRGRDQALDMFARLSGRTHQVLTGVALVGPHAQASRLSVSHVRFRPTSAAERAAYWATGEPADKAGGYAIQGRAALFVEHLEGSYSGVMGLPLFETGELLDQFGLWPLPAA